jgi:hypothetical protein
MLDASTGILLCRYLSTNALMKQTLEGITLSLMSTLLCGLTFLGALGVDPTPQTQQQGGMTASRY